MDFGKRKTVNEPVNTFTDVERYENGQLYLMTDGSFIYVYDVEEPSKMNHSENTRAVYGYIGVPYTKKGLFSSDTNVLIGNPQMKQQVVINVRNKIKIAISEMRRREALYIGKVSQNKRREISSHIEDY